MFRSNRTNKTRGRFLNLKKQKSSDKKVSWKAAPLPEEAKPTSEPTILANQGFSQQEMREFQESFALFDTEGNGSIGVGELRAVLESLQGEDPSAYPHLERVLEQLPANDETLDFDGYLQVMASTSLHQRLETEGSGPPNYQHVFDLFDVDQKGYITVENLQSVAVELGEYDMSREELEDMILRARPTEDGKVTLAEFSKIMSLNLFQRMDQFAEVQDN